MSERGSFVTEFIYCEKCFNAVSNFFKTQPQCFPTQIFSRNIIAGYISDLMPGGEILVMEDEFKDKIEKLICHKIRIAVLAENYCESIILMHPKESENA